MKTVFDDLNLGNEKFVDKDLFIGEVNKIINPQLTIPSITSLPMESGERYASYWTGTDNPFKSPPKDATIGERYAPSLYTKEKLQPHILQTYIPNTPFVPMYDLGVGSTHFSPLENPNIKEGGLTLGHTRVMFDPQYPKTTIETERQSDYAQRYNIKNPRTGEGAFDEYLRVLKEPLTPPTSALARMDHTIELREGIYKGDDWIKKTLQKEASEHWTSRSLHELVKDHYNGSQWRREDLSFSEKGFNELTHNELLQVINTPSFKRSVDIKVEHWKSKYDSDVIAHEKQILINKKELYNIENPSELSTKLKKECSCNIIK